jgi:hypothetical protein
MKTLTGTLFQLDVKNLNGRIYQDNDNLRKSIEDYNNKPSKYGQIGFPENDDYYDQSIREISHTVENVRIDGDRVVGDIRILNTHSGKILKELLDDGIPHVFRSRAIGHTNEDGTVNIKKIFAFDAIPKNIDSFDMSNKPKEKEIKRIYSDQDPYGEEDWED